MPQSLCLLVLITCAGSGCTGWHAGPNKEGTPRLMGALTGAGTGAVTGFQLGSGTGPGAAVGAGVGAVAGSLRGAIQDTQEEENKRLALAIEKAEERSVAQRTIGEYYEKRLKWHPSRDLFPADIFFRSDEVDLSLEGSAIIDEFGRLNDERFPWSRFGVVVYIKSSDKNSSFARYLAERRAVTITNRLVKAGLEPRRVEAHGTVVQEVVFRDPDEVGERYAQAVEFVPLDR
jgi:hypothetical protein